MRESSIYFANGDWTLLPDSLLNSWGKTIVTADPTLSDETISKLIKSRDGQLKPCNFYFGEGDSSDIGLTMISICIKENKDATMAELVAKYCELRKIPFIETAVAVVSHRKKHGLYYSEPDREQGGYLLKLWFPNEGAKYAKPPKKRIV